MSQQQQFEKLFMPLGGAVVGGTIGAVLWKEHRFLGFLAGSSVGSAPIYALQGDYRMAATNLIATAVGYLAARRWKMHPVIGFFGAGFASRFIVAPVVDRLLPAAPNDPLATAVREIVPKNKAVTRLPTAAFRQ